MKDLLIEAYPALGSYTRERLAEAAEAAVRASPPVWTPATDAAPTAGGEAPDGDGPDSDGDEEAPAP